MSCENYYSSAKHRVWRQKVLRRAKYLCQECARFGLRTPATVAHHLLPVEEYPDRRFDLENGAALCSACHNKAHPEKLARD